MSSIKVEEHFIQIVGFCQNIKIYDHCMKLIRPFLIPCVLRLSKNVVAWNATLYAWLLLQWELAWHFWNLILATWIGNALGHLACYKCQGMKCQFCKTLCECWSKCSTSFCINVLGLFLFCFSGWKVFWLWNHNLHECTSDCQLHMYFFFIAKNFCSFSYFQPILGSLW